METNILEYSELISRQSELISQIEDLAHRMDSLSNILDSYKFNASNLARMAERAPKPCVSYQQALDLRACFH
jgi:uncharacterized protein Yka (UPF0111/DUF47 family)